MSELTPPPAQPLHIAWRGIRPGDAVLLAAAILGGGLYVLLDLSWGRGLIASAAIGLVVVLVLPYRGLRLGTVLWLRFRHAWDALLTWLFPTRHQQLSTLLAQPTKPSLALLDAAPDPTDTAA